MRTAWILGDQLSLGHAALAGLDPARDVVLMVESRARGAHRRYHKRKLVLVYSAMRHYAEDLRRSGWRVDYHRLEDTPSFPSALSAHVRRFQPDAIRVMEASDWTTTEALPRMAATAGVALEVLPTNLFLVGRDEFREWAGGSRRLLMEHHYRRVRRGLGLLMEADGTPSGGTWNLDAENRLGVAEWRKAGAPRPPSVGWEPPDACTREVMTWVDREFAGHPGDVGGFGWPVERAGALRWLQRFVEERLPQFGPFEDLMVTGEPGLFHSMLTPMLNLGLLGPLECARAAETAWREGRVPLASAEGFVRQVVGWREFVNGVYWLKGPGYATSNGLGAERSLPGWFWTGKTELKCMATVLGEALDTGYNHHIQRLMVLGNFLLLTGVRPGEALRWFNEMYVDAQDWVMAANVLGMALHADGGFMATKPYAAGGAYLSRMSDYCDGCRYSPKVRTGKGACPFNLWYWRFMDLHAQRFASNPRMATIVRSWAKRPEPDRRQVLADAEAALVEHGGGDEMG
ncbi:MAG: cryptochrome/photolyase family protein [Verrucomicrobiota bacterium]|jgi:deoxyribodipyrimidine photolyase-related protein